MSVLGQLEPQRVFYYFEEITRIPHGSGNVDAISNYLANFAKERGLFYIQDELKNVIIVKEASKGYEKEPAVILQGHMDMVAVKTPDCSIDLKREGLQIATDGDAVFAKGTSLGGDDGIAVAYALAILESDTMKHPRLEVVFTVDEEVGMEGATGIDLSMLTAKRMLNLDSEDEGILLTGCAGGVRQKCTLMLQQKEQRGTAYKITVAGLLGGHSGVEIHKERGNAINLLGRILCEIGRACTFHLMHAEGGEADNAIPREASAVILLSDSEESVLEATVSRLNREIAKELATRDGNVQIAFLKLGTTAAMCAEANDTHRASGFLWALPNGVQCMSADVEGLVETSLNLGVLRYEAGEFSVTISLRSSVESAKKALVEKVAAITRLAGGSYTLAGDYPGWKYRADSPLRDKMVRIYEAMYGEKPKVEAVHAGLECGIIADKIPDLDCVSFGPQMENIHTTEERLSISSTRRVWEYLLKILEEREE
ncbi:MAG: aminoacyl-histidine dipeptidase [Lachnospiraceae bacterium]|nr:aminoacyl-histidine dipeptidase [Lachnospiraceae bacterium]